MFVIFVEVIIYLLYNLHDCNFKKSTAIIFLTLLSIFLTNMKNSFDTRYNPPRLICSTHDFVRSRKVRCLSWSSFNSQCVSSSNKAKPSGERLLLTLFSSYTMNTLLCSEKIPPLISLKASCYLLPLPRFAKASRF